MKIQISKGAKNNKKESFEGVGTLQCFGNMTVDMNEGEIAGVAQCRPEFENPDNGITYAPQGFIADGEDGSHWVGYLSKFVCDTTCVRIDGGCVCEVWLNDSGIFLGFSIFTCRLI